MRVLLIGDLRYLHIRRWATGLSQQGVNVSVLSETRVQLPEVRTISSFVPTWRPWRPRRWLGRWRSVFRRALKQGSFDLIHLHFPDRHSLFLEDIKGYPFVVSTWGS